MTAGAWMRIGAYQLGNVIRNQTKFTYFDLRGAEARASGAVPAELLVGAEPATLADVVAKAQAAAARAEGSLGSPSEKPFVLLCEDGAESARAAEALVAAGFVNVFVVEGGAKGLV